MAVVRQRFIFHGRVQGVGFRYTARRAATDLGLTGWVRNERDGTVSMEVQGEQADIRRLIGTLKRDTYIRIDAIDQTEVPVVGPDREDGFHTRA